MEMHFYFTGISFKEERSEKGAKSQVVKYYPLNKPTVESTAQAFKPVATSFEVRALWFAKKFPDKKLALIRTTRGKKKGQRFVNRAFVIENGSIAQKGTTFSISQISEVTKVGVTRNGEVAVVEQDDPIVLSKLPEFEDAKKQFEAEIAEAAAQVVHESKDFLFYRNIKDYLAGKDFNLIGIEVENDKVKVIEAENKDGTFRAVPAEMLTEVQSLYNSAFGKAE